MGEKLRESDRLVVAGQPLPEELMPHDRIAGSAVCSLLREFVQLSPHHRQEIHALVTSQPQYQRTASSGMPAAYRSYSSTGEPGPVVMRLLGNRNLSSTSVAKAVHTVTGGRRYWAASSYNMLGVGRKALTPDLLGDLSALIDLPVGVLEELTGVVPQAPPADVGALVWDCRRLTEDQIRDVAEKAEKLR
ncbi:hypothetical protein [Lentzea sp. CC55]|uniref:hypothetical protein n=1 Tax=Lentzea sp. CC55 TaxID=2884909 RepID=UPI001F42B216|nr:hypothetical protein [Lentzea sp. CC55]MCG8927536.1 hypothetical protein [Lentzea sp. CC55]